MIWYYVPPNFRDLVTLKDSMGPGVRHLVVAPTGTGKSTMMVSFLHRTLKPKFHKIILIEPRTLLVQGLVPFLRSKIGLPVSGGTSGMVLDKTQDIWVMTPQYLLINEDFLRPDFLFIVDEAHIMEPAYILCLRILKAMNLPVVLTTATPSDDLIHYATGSTTLRLASLFSITEKVVTLETSVKDLGLSYYKMVSDLIDGSPPSAKFLVFVPDVKMATKFYEQCSRKSDIVYSGKSTIDKNAKVIFSTSVTDAGVTIPNVDYVVTMDIDRRVGTLGGDAVVSPFLVRLPNSILRQRRGRTGRTNNGLFYLIKVKTFEENAIVPEFVPPVKDMVSDWLSAGIRPGLICSFNPEVMLKFLGVNEGSGEYGTDLSRAEADTMIDMYSKEIDEIVSKVLPIRAFRQYQDTLTTLDQSKVRQLDFTPRGRIYPGEWANWGAVMADIVRGAGYRVRNALHLPGTESESDVEDFLDRWSHLMARSFGVSISLEPLDVPSVGPNVTPLTSSLVNRQSP